MIIRKNDINSIFPTIIKIIKLNFEVVNKLAKSILLTPNISEVEVFVIVKTDILNDFSKLILSTIKTLDKINRLKLYHFSTLSNSELDSIKNRDWSRRQDLDLRLLEPQLKALLEN